MKKIKLFLCSITLCIAVSGFSQTGACCTKTGGCLSPVTHVVCDSSIHGTIWMVGKTCTPNPCGIMICCFHGCNAGVAEAQCKSSGASNPWFPDKTCDVCSPAGSANLGSLTAVYSDETKSVQLSWIIDSAMDNPEFYIERSRDGEKFKSIGFLNENPVNNTFSFTDINPYQVGYYRLFYAANEHAMYSQVINVIGVDKNRFLLSPNPTAGNVKILLNNMQLYTTDISIYDQVGRLVLSRKLSNGQHDLDLTSLSRGSFVIRAMQNGQTYTSKLIRN